MKKSQFIVIDGADGSGKKTQADLLIKRLKKLQVKAVLMDFPAYDEFFGKMVRSYLDGDFGGLGEVSPYLASMLFALDRWQAKPKIENYLKRGYIVISNRYAESNMAHQGAKFKNPKERDKYLRWLTELEFKVFGIPRADQIIYLDVPAEISQKLIEGRQAKKDIHEADIDYLKKTQAEYHRLSRLHHWLTISCTRNGQLLSRDEIAEMIWSVLEKKLKSA